MNKKTLNRRKFFTIIGAGGAALAVRPVSGMSSEILQTQAKPATNISDAAKNPEHQPQCRVSSGKVVVVKNMNSVVDDVPVSQLHT